MNITLHSSLIIYMHVVQLLAIKLSTQLHVFLKKNKTIFILGLPCLVRFLPAAKDTQKHFNKMCKTGC